MKRTASRLLALLMVIIIILSIGSCAKEKTDGSENNHDSEGTSPNIEPSNPSEPIDKVDPTTGTASEPEFVQESIEEKVKKAAERLEVWDGSIAESFDGGDGSIGNPYRIRTGSQLAKLSNDTNNGIDFKNTYFIVTEDILLNDPTYWDFEMNTLTDITKWTNSWIPIASKTDNYNNKYSFLGNFDGNGHTIYGLYNRNNYYQYWATSQPYVRDSFVGLFGRIEADIKNLNLACAFLSPSAEAVGVLAGCVNAGTIDNCHVMCSAVENRAEIYQVELTPCIGGICGKVGSEGRDVTISNCSFDGTLVRAVFFSGYGASVGGIIGTLSGNQSYINNCLSRCDIAACEILKSNLRASNRECAINVGGIVGNAMSGRGIQNCYSICNQYVQPFSQVFPLVWNAPKVNLGGIAGSSSIDLLNCGSIGCIEYTGDVTEKENVCIGGIAGLLVSRGDRKSMIEVNLNGCYSSCRIEDNGVEKMGGGIVGGASGAVNIENCYFDKAFADYGLRINKTFKYDIYNAPMDSRIFTNRINSLQRDELKDSKSYETWDFISSWSTSPNIIDGFPLPNLVINSVSYIRYTKSSTIGELIREMLDLMSERYNSEFINLTDFGRYLGADFSFVEARFPHIVPASTDDENNIYYFDETETSWFSVTNKGTIDRITVLMFDNNNQSTAFGVREGMNYEEAYEVLRDRDLDHLSSGEDYLEADIIGRDNRCYEIYVYYNEKDKDAPIYGVSAMMTGSL